MSAAAAHAARQKNKAKKEAAAKKENSPSKWSFRSKKVEDEPAEGVETDGDDDAKITLSRPPSRSLEHIARCFARPGFLRPAQALSVQDPH